MFEIIQICKKAWRLQSCINYLPILGEIVHLASMWPLVRVWCSFEASKINISGHLSGGQVVVASAFKKTSISPQICQWPFFWTFTPFALVGKKIPAQHQQVDKNQILHMHSWILAEQSLFYRETFLPIQSVSTQRGWKIEMHFATLDFVWKLFQSPVSMKMDLDVYFSFKLGFHKPVFDSDTDQENVAAAVQKGPFFLLTWFRSLRVLISLAWHVSQPRCVEKYFFLTTWHTHTKKTRQC